MSSDIPKFNEELIYANGHGLLKDVLGRALVSIFDAGVAGDFEMNELTKRVVRHRIRRAFEGEFPIPRNTTGELIQGFDNNGRYIRIKLNWLLAPSLTIGSTGAGKSLKSLWLAIQFALFTSCLWLIDTTKHEWRRIAPLLKRMGIDLLIVHGQSFRFNPLETPAEHISPSIWINRISELLVHVLELPHRASQLLQITLQELYIKYGVYDGKAIYPCMYDLLHHVRSNTTTNAQARFAVTDAIEALIAGASPELFSYRVGWNTSRLSSLAINIVLNDVSDTVRDVLLNSLLLAELTTAISEGHSNVEKPRLFISVDEAGPILRKSGSTHNILLDSLSLVRGLGISIDLSVASSKSIAPEIVSYASTRYIGRVNSHDDLDMLGRSMGLSAQQKLFAFQKLRTGEFICQVGAADNDLRIPYLVRVPHMSFPSDLGSTADNLGELSTWKVVQATEYLNQGSIHTSSADEESDSSSNVFGDEREYLFCKCIESSPLKPSSWYPKRIKISTKTAVKIRKILVGLGLIQIHELDRGGRGRPSFLLEITANGETALREYESANKERRQ